MERFRQIQSKLCVAKQDGIQIHPSRIDNHQTITQILDEGYNKYHTFKLPEEKILRTVPEILSTDEIDHNLLVVVFQLITVSRMHEKIERTRVDLPVIHVQLVNPCNKKSFLT